MVRLICAFGIVVAVFCAASTTPQSRMSAQQLLCLHGPSEAPDQAARRKLALALVRRINSLQTQYHANGRGYQQLSSLPDVQTPAGFSIQLIIHAAGYALSVKDKGDPCRFAYFSDQEQVIYTAQAVR